MFFDSELCLLVLRNPVNLVNPVKESLLVKKLFDEDRKLLIGVVHLRPLPGSPRWRGDLEAVIESAVIDARAYERGGTHALFIENFGDVPFTKGNVGPETVAAMASPGAPTGEGGAVAGHRRGRPPGTGSGLGG